MVGKRSCSLAVASGVQVKNVEVLAICRDEHGSNCSSIFLTKTDRLQNVEAGPDGVRYTLPDTKRSRRFCHHVETSAPPCQRTSPPPADQPRGTPYLATGLIRLGSGFGDGLPSRNATVAGSTLILVAAGTASCQLGLLPSPRSVLGSR